ncbi:MAG: nucleotidyltransferase [Chloroflexi bacterium]|nr:nucleotidyltransferase [Chloroflexota bacterium]MDL1942907.1 nucleotidyltransferase [Chloroflexi bacterium CFX2]
MTRGTMKIVIPMAGWGTRMRPHTWSKPKPLVSVAGKTSLEHLLDMFKTLPDPENTEFVFIVGPYLGELQIPAFIKENYPSLKAHYVVQNEMKGQSHALWLARGHLQGPMIMCFSDTLMETDFSFLANEQADGVAWVMPVEDPRRFGVAETGADGWVKRFIEKPQSMENNLVVVGCYYFGNSAQLLAAIEEQMERGVMLKNEYFLTDAISIMIERGAKIRTQKIATWLDTGTIDATLDTNKILLEKSKPANTYTGTQVKVVEPSSIHPSAVISNSTIGPYASIGANCRIENAWISESIVEAECEIQDAALTRSLIGRQAKVRGRGDDHVMQLNIGDTSSVSL